MVFHMKTTLQIDDSVMKLLKVEAARRKKTMSELVEMALRLFLGRRLPASHPKPLPTWRSGGALVDVANRRDLYDAMGGRS